MTIETIADMVWALDQAIKVEIHDPTAIHGLNYFISPMQAQASEFSKSSNELPRTTPEKVPQPNAPLVMVMGD